ncbi:bis(5'-nucleosyl)-tetraphosphatase [Thiohalomonas denitrificans]|uniref:Bis(5'-nucleosyl)-tetraphosphatase [asymmetrical] n=1 Tax=Thiohalomonas denitrificans TaxID=415747 RepID=A0A1G5PTQ2_9GAMM|nr:NUDIX domain-containing protein [Thiohalomonas denitrificans]SCZ52788.1 8-oxo-dGTP pyrophosphatase MutT, NUDIX family [Thiohalomonas denitrificans]
MARTLSAGVVVVRRFKGSWWFLLLRAYRNWDFPKGRVEENETPMQAALREVAEETGIEDLRFPWGKVYSETAPYRRNKVARYYLGETRQERFELRVNPDLGRPEHHEGRWCTSSEAARLLPDRLQPVLSWAVAMIERGEVKNPDHSRSRS